MINRDNHYTSGKRIQSTDKWIQRFGVVALRGYKRIQATESVFELLAMAMEDSERDVRKVAAWILREITKANSNRVAEFLAKQAKTALSRDKKCIINLV